MRDSVWSGPVLAGALIANATLLVVLSTQVEVTPPPKPQIVVERDSCSADDVKRWRNRIAKLRRARLLDQLEPQRSPSDMEAEQWRHDGIADARAALVECDWRTASNIDVCEGFDPHEAQVEITWRQQMRSDFARYRFITTDSSALEMVTGMCAISGARPWPRAAAPWPYHRGYDSISKL